MSKKTVIYLTEVNDSNKTGLFNSIVTRISKVKGEKKVLNLSYYDTLTIKVIKSILRVEVKTKKSDFVSDGVEFESFHLPCGLTYYLLLFFGLKKVILRLNAKSILAYLNSERIDVRYISAHWGVTAGLLSDQLKLISNYKNSITLHGSDVHTIPLRNQSIKVLLLDALSRSDVNIFVSNCLLKQASELGYKGNNYQIIYNAIDSNYFYNKKESGIVTEKKIITAVFVGNLQHIKGADRLCNIISKSDPKLVRFIVAGDGEYMGELETQGDKTQLLGHIDKNSVRNLLSEADVLLLPSRNEGLPLIILEAIAAGVTVLATDVGGIPEVLEDKYMISNNQPEEDLIDDFIFKISNTDFDRTKNSVFPKQFDIEELTIRENEIYEMLN
ncbi:glycosyltransferase [Proteus terrae]|uniref:glycosyltransferase n=1 Tax=Proteus terrae TaxID=1574161 RepID=UPI00389E8936